jgi:formiminotetrahydrofolate cyclodeaminase
VDPVDLVDLPVTRLLDELASAAPAPGGGSAAALAGAAAAALCAMACRLTLGREAHRAAWPDAEAGLARAETLGAALRGLVDEDSRAYREVAAALGLPRGTAGEKDRRRASLAAATLEAARVPLRTLEAASDCAGLAALIVEKGNPSCATDAGTAAALARAAARGAAYNVRVNLPGIADAAERERLAARTRVLLARAEAGAGRADRALAARQGEEEAAG